MLELFAGRLDDFAVQSDDGQRYARAGRPLTVEEVARHLRGEQTIGIYALNGSQHVRWLCWDIDHLERELLERLFESARVLGIREDALLREFSGSKGWHLWTFFSEPVPARDARRLGRLVERAAKLPLPLEIYPRQDEMTVGKGLGNLVKLPLGVHRKSGRWADVVDPPGQLEPMSGEELQELLQPYPDEATPIRSDPRRSLPRRPPAGSPLFPCTHGMLGATWSEGIRNRAAFLIAKRLYRSGGLSFEQALAELRQWNAEQVRPPLPDQELVTVARSAQNYTGMDCEDPLVVPFCQPHCPIYPSVYPQRILATGGPQLEMVMTEPPTFNLPLSVGWVRGLTAEQLQSHHTVVTACLEQLGVLPPTIAQRPWRQQVQQLLDNCVRRPAPPEISQPGRVLELYRQWAQRASEDPQELERRQAWHDTLHQQIVFQGVDFLAFVRRAEPKLPEKLVWAVLSERLRAHQAERELEGRRIPVWEVPVSE